MKNRMQGGTIFDIGYLFLLSQKPDATNNEIEPTNLVEIAEKASLSGSSILRAIDAKEAERKQEEAENVDDKEEEKKEEDKNSSSSSSSTSFSTSSESDSE